ncbi:MAG: hypothetical protein PVF96_07695 [Candidatus Bathyarchaeota archaeon]
MKRDLIVVVLLTFCLTALLFQVLPISSQSAGDYDPWYDVNDDGTIDMRDIGGMARKFGTSGTPINKTELLLELQSRLDELDTLVASLRECTIVIGYIPYDGNGAYDSLNGLSQDVSGLIPSGFTLVAAVATGYKAHQMTGARQDEPPLILEPKVSGMTFQTRVWDASGDEYGGANWASMVAHIDYTLFVIK